MAGLRGTKAILGPSAGSVDSECGIQAGGTEALAGTCARDAQCFFGPPLPLPVPDFPFFSTCVVSVLDQGACGDLDTGAQTTTFSAGVASRVYVTADIDNPCPRCVPGTCNGGENGGQPCTPVGSLGTTHDCPPEKILYDGTLSVVLNGASTATLQSAPANGLCCPNQVYTGAFGVPAVRRIQTHGSPLDPVALLGTTAASTVAAPFCIPPTGVAFLDAGLGIPAPAAVSVPVRIDLADLLLLGLPPLLP